MNADARMTRRLEQDRIWADLCRNLVESMINQISPFGMYYQGPRVADINATVTSVMPKISRMEQAIMERRACAWPNMSKAAHGPENCHSVDFTDSRSTSLTPAERDAMSVATGDDWG